MTHDRARGLPPPALPTDRHLLDTAFSRAAPMYIADGAGRLVMTNPAFETLRAARWGDGAGDGTGLAPGPLREIFGRLGNGEDRVACDETFGANGTRRRYHSNHHRIEDADGDTAFTGQYIEIPLDAGDAGMDAPQATVSHAAAAKNAFLGKMSHEMRTPLNAIIGFAEMSESQPFGPLDQRYVSYLRNIGHAARHLSGMIGDVLELARVSAGPEAEEAAASVVALADAVAEARESVAELARRRGIDLRAVATSDDWRVAADRGRLHRVCVNLLENAVKYTEPGGRVGVEIARADTPDMLDIVIWDTGIGIAPDRHERIFESFHRVGPEALHLPTNGAGLGLTVSRHLVRQMRGDIAVDSIPGIGSRFVVRLPEAGDADGT